MLDAYRVLGYTLDVVESPEALLYGGQHVETVQCANGHSTDGLLGHVVQFSDANPDVRGARAINFSRKEGDFLRCGDTLSIEVDVDPTFAPTRKYKIIWLIANVGGPRIEGSKFVLTLGEKYVSTHFTAVCRVISDKGWHRLGDHDDQIDIVYRVLPPV